MTTVTTATVAPPVAAHPSLDESQWHRSAALCGLAFVALSVTSFFLPGAPPASDDGAANVARYFTDLSRRHPRRLHR